VFVHVTVVPASMVRASGAKAAVPRTAAFTGIETDDDGPLDGGGVADAGTGVGAGLVGAVDE